MKTKKAVLSNRLRTAFTRVGHSKLTMNISSFRKNYFRILKACISGNEYTDTHYRVQDTDIWKKCTSCYCHIHGLRNRQILDDKAQQRLKDHESYIHLSIHCGQATSIETLNHIYTTFKEYIFYNDESAEMLKGIHWMPSRKNKKLLLPHAHAVLATNTKWPRSRLKSLLTAAARLHGHPSPSKIRMGYKQYTTPQWALDYILFLGTNKNNIRIPPPEVRWELMRLGKPRKQKTPKKKTDPTTYTDDKCPTHPLERPHSSNIPQMPKRPGIGILLGTGHESAQIDFRPTHLHSKCTIMYRRPLKCQVPEVKKYTENYRYDTS